MKQKTTPTLLSLLLTAIALTLMLLAIVLQVSDLGIRQVKLTDSLAVDGHSELGYSDLRAGSFTFWLQVAAHAWQPAGPHALWRQMKKGERHEDH